MIFISHSSKDNLWARRIGEWLIGEKYNSIFLDFHEKLGITGGCSWRDTLYEELQSCRAVIVISSKDYCASQWCLAELGVAMEKGKLVLPVRIDDSPLPKLLTETQAIDLVPETEQVKAWSKLLSGLSQLKWQERLKWPPEDEPEASPFPGLSCFESKHAPVFFGQEDALLQVQRKLDCLAPSESTLLLILGASGCGKSSLLRAAVLPWLDAEQDRWIVLEPFRPGNDPFGWMARALGLSASAKPTTASDLLSQLDALRMGQNKQEAKVVLAIDQFEELLAVPDRGGDQQKSAADAFLKVMAELLAHQNSRLVILATLRSDFLNRLQLHASGLHRLAAEPILLGPLDEGGFRAVIEEPARVVNLQLESGLSDDLVTDTATGDALPLLAFTLRELWRERPSQGKLTKDQYVAFGGLAGAVKLKAEELFNPSIDVTEADKAEKDALRRAFLDHLVRLSADGQVTKQPARRRDLPKASLGLVDKFVDARLLVSGKGAGKPKDSGLEAEEDNDWVEIAHEALLRTWPTLVGWLKEGKEELLQRRRVQRLCEELAADREQATRVQALGELARLAARGEGASEGRAVFQAAPPELERLAKNQDLAEPERADAALVLALIGAEQPLRDVLVDGSAPVGLRRRAAESLGLLAQRSGDNEQRRRIAAELEGWLRRELLDVQIETSNDPAAGWKQHDDLMPLLQGASSGLQLAASPDLPLLGSGPGRVVPMLTLTALEEGPALRLRTQVVEVSVWKLPLPGGKYLELVIVPKGLYTIGRQPEEMQFSDLYAKALVAREALIGCKTTDLESQREVNLEQFAMVRHPITQAQWRAVAELKKFDMNDSVHKNDFVNPGIYGARGLWDTHAQPDAYPVDSVTWENCNDWLQLLNGWLMEQVPWKGPDGKGEAPQLALPSESQWEAACNAGTNPFHFGDTLDASWANFDGGKKYVYGLGREGSFRRYPTSTGSFGLVNRFGLAEMHGQFWEWCGDQWHPNPIGEGWPRDGKTWVAEDPVFQDQDTDQKDWKLLRGGSWFVDPRGCRASLRRPERPDNIDTDIGFRPCCHIPLGMSFDS
jgi:formylglycine-generating enzyme required for sulfatase activity